MAFDVALTTFLQARWPRCVFAVLAFIGSVQAQELRTTPSTSLSTRISDNPFQLAEVRAQRNWIAELSVGLTSLYNSRTAQLSVDYRVNRLAYSSNKEADSTQNFLNANLRTELVDDLFFIDANSIISQQNRSAFGVASSRDESSTSSNRVETRTASISPVFRGRFSADILFQARTRLLEARARSDLLPDSRSLTSSFGIRNEIRNSALGWTLESDDLRAEGDELQRRRNSRTKASLTYALGSQLTLTVFAGREQSNLDGENGDSNKLLGAGMSWTPSERTQLSFIGGKRFFGNDYVMSLAHRMPSAAVRLGVVRDITFLESQSGANDSSVLLSMLGDLMTAAIPDPVAREQAARRRFEESSAATVSFSRAGVATTRPVVNQRAELTILALGMRNTASLSVSTRRQSGLDSLTSNNLQATLAQNVRQRGANSSWAFRASPLATLSYTFGVLHSESLIDARTFTWQRQHSVILTRRLGSETTATLTVRRAQISSNTIQSNVENSASATISHRF